eukprot:TRINITY_DN15304_c0_g1_i1.p1 TRINITY_DN15304_c0_g1~~TRINITY_DN15304_c0_g1_i1.p1  ORF type:complete len:552 (+),score=106.82 TRINITY_DN15304_c0_g1_i1:74-1657(+)
MAVCAQAASPKALTGDDIVKPARGVRIGTDSTCTSLGDNEVEDKEQCDTPENEEEHDEAIEDFRSTEERLKDIKVATIGNVDSGKSTLVGVLTKGILDDGRGKARSRVFNFSHEAANGRTSSVAQEIMGFDGDGEQVVSDRPTAATATSKNNAWQHIVSNSQRVVTFIDLCGHEKYLKTTIFGLIGLCPDYALIVVNANAGFQKMSREHLGIALALRIPITIVVTKVDIAPQNVYEECMRFLCRLLKSNAVGKEPIVVKTQADVACAAGGIASTKVCPIFCVSSVTGDGMDLLKAFVRTIPSRQKESGLFRPPSAPAEFHIDGVFSVTGVGIVASGLLRSGTVRPNQQLLLGPNKTSQFTPVLVRTVHYKRCLADAAESGQACSFALRSLDKKNQLKKASFRKGMVLVDPILQPQTTWEFKAETVILHHATTIRVGYQAMIHCGIIRQCALVRSMSCELLRTGDKAIVTFRFLFHGEYLTPDTTILFREGRTKGLGRVVELVDEDDVEEKDFQAIRKAAKMLNSASS